MSVVPSLCSLCCSHCMTLRSGVTLVRTEAPLAVVVIAAGGSTPQLAVIATCAGTGVVLVPKEDEGEHARGSL